MKNWFITGISRGLGFAIAKEVLSRGDRVIGTVRGNPPDLQSSGGRLQTVVVEMNDPSRVVNAVHEAFATCGHIDVIVNNAGFGVLGALEVTSEEDIRKIFEVDVFAPANIMRTALPYFRRQGSGHIVNITSIAARAPGIGSSVYASAKYALEGLSAALSQEVAPYGIKVTAVAPGQFRTDFLAGIVVRKGIDHDGGKSGHLDAALQKLEQVHHQQLGDPALAAKAIVDAVYSEAPPLHLLLGSDAIERARAKLQAVVEEMKKWEDTTLSTDFRT